MISLDLKTETSSSSSSPISTDSKEEKPTLSFSELLSGVVEKKGIKNGAIVLPAKEGEDQEKGTGSKTSLLLSLQDELGEIEDIDIDLLKDSKDLKKDTLMLSLQQLAKDAKKTLQEENSLKITDIDLEEAQLTEDLLELNPKLSKNISSEELKVVIKDAKEYLKNKIIQSDGYKRSEVKELPKTLKGLSELAKKYDIDLSKITLEEVKVQEGVKGEKRVQSTQISLESSDDNSLNLPPKEESKKSSSQTLEGSDLVDEPAELKIQKTKKDLKATANDDIDRAQEQSKTQQKSPLAEKSLNDDIDRAQEQSKTQQKSPLAEKSLQSTPLLKTQTQSEHSTEQIVQSKILQTQPKTKTKQKADETLQLLLRGEKASKSDGSKLGVDFSVATARVIAPSAQTEGSKSLESLLHNDTSQEETKLTSKVDGVQISKADSFEVKLNEAKQMTKYLSQDVKTAIDNYKSPFTRVKVQLNPQRLGEIDLTIVQRGKNLHINLSSNNAAINALSMNANDLKLQLQNNGIQNASLHFNNGSDNGSNAQSNAQQQQNRQHAQQQYKAFDINEEHEELLSSLEIIIPSYA
jgi:hypothetical protein